MARQRPADHLPSALLVQPDFVRACAERDLGEVLRLAKQLGGVGFSASHLARRCELTVSRVSDYINGNIRAQRVEIFERVADGLHIPGRMFDLAPRPWEEDSVETGSHANAVNTKKPPVSGDPSVLRRDFVKLSTGIVAAGLPALPGIPSRTSGNSVGPTTTVELKKNLARLRRLDDHLGGADTYSLYSAEVEKSARLLKNASFSTIAQRELLKLLAEQTQQAGWAAFDAGWQQEAQRLFQWSFTVAKEANDPALAGNALALRSYQLLSTGTVTTELTEKSCSIAMRNVHPAVQSLLYQRAAWTYAVAGDAAQAAQALGHAEEALVATGCDEPGPDWAMWAHNPVEFRIMTGRCWAELHRPLRAVPALETAMSEYSDSHARDKALYLSWLADAYIDAGEIEQATATINRAMALAADVASARPRGRLITVLERLDAH